MRTTNAMRLSVPVAPAAMWLSVAVVLLAGAIAAKAATFAVNSTTDAADATPGDGVCETASGNGVCTLRAAVEEANVSTGSDAIGVPGGTYTLLAGQLLVSDDVAITGAGAGTTVVDANGGRGFCVSAGTVSIAGVRVEHGDGGEDCVGNFGMGGGLLNAGGTLTLSDSTVTGSTSGGIWNLGTLALNNVTVSGNTAPSVGGVGGGIINGGSLTLTGSMVSGNTGGGIENADTLVLTGSTVSGNTGAGIANDGPATLDNATVRANLGGGIVNNHVLAVRNSTLADNVSDLGGGLLSIGPATLINSTLSGNHSTSGGGAISFLGCFRSSTLTLNNVTITQNTADDGGGLFTHCGMVTVSNSLLAGNTRTGGEDSDCGGYANVDLTSGGYNLIRSLAGCTIDGDPTGNLIGVSPTLGPLQDNGGPTETHALLPGSPAIDAGNPAAPGSGDTACEAIDQRGVARPQGTRCDIGAVEVGGTPTTTTTSSTTTTTLPSFCTPVPRGDCEPALSAKGSVRVQDRADDARDRFSWKWRSGTPIAKLDFGSPTATTDYTLCVYDQSNAGGTLRLASAAPAGGTCGSSPCWKERSTGFRYADKELTPDGLIAIRLGAGAAGAARIVIKGRGTALPMPTLPLTPPVTVQVQRRDGVACWAATFSAPAVNTAEKLMAKPD